VRKKATKLQCDYVYSPKVRNNLETSSKIKKKGMASTLLKR